jgi:hypothetical protein
MQRQVLWMDRQDITSSRDCMLWLSEQGCRGCRLVAVAENKSCMQCLLWLTNYLRGLALLGTCGLCLLVALVLWLAYIHTQQVPSMATGNRWQCQAMTAQSFTFNRTIQAWACPKFELWGYPPENIVAAIRRSSSS